MPDALLSAPAPGRVLAAGDWHANTRWARHVIREAKALLADEDRRIILHLGDFGIWPGEEGRDYLFRVSAALDQADAELWFVDGNHEDFSRLDAEKERAPWMARGSRTPIPIGSGSAAIGARISWLWRGFRWEWHGRTWLALGGGVSLDKGRRTEGKDWWPQEEITAGQERDVMLTHECPSGVTHTFPPPPSWWDPADLARNDAHRERLQRVVDAVRPLHLMHGHLHIGYQRMCDVGFGPVQVTGLDCDGKEWNYAILDARSMEWETALHRQATGTGCTAATALSSRSATGHGWARGCISAATRGTSRSTPTRYGSIRVGSPTRTRSGASTTTSGTSGNQGSTTYGVPSPGTVR
jgi:Calcineurin-like phosphoesterase